MSSKSIHVVANGRMHFFLMAEKYSTVYIHHLFFIHSSTDSDYSLFFLDNCWARHLLQRNTSWGDICWGQDCPVRCRNRKRPHAEAGIWQCLHSLKDRKWRAKGIWMQGVSQLSKRADTHMWNKNEKGTGAVELLYYLPWHWKVPVSDRTFVGLCPLKCLLRWSHLPWLVPVTEIPLQEWVGGRRKEADLLKKQRMELRKPPQRPLESRSWVWRMGPHLDRVMVFMGGLTGDPPDLMAA